jgi:serine/threonine-protein kinase
MPASWSADGKALLLVHSSGIFKLAIDSQTITPVLESSAPYQYLFPALSPDGRWLAYTSTENGHQNVWVTPYPSLSGRRPVSTQGGDSPVWTRGGSEIVYYEPINGGGGRLMAVAFAPAGSLPNPEILFTKTGAEFARASPLPGFAVTSDGKRFLAVVGDPNRYPPRTTIDVVFHWLDTMPARLGGAR